MFTVQYMYPVTGRWKNMWHWVQGCLLVLLTLTLFTSLFDPIPVLRDGIWLFCHLQLT